MEQFVTLIGLPSEADLPATKSLRQILDEIVNHAGGNVECAHATESKLVVVTTFQDTEREIQCWTLARQRYGWRVLENWPAVSLDTHEKIYASTRGREPIAARR